MTDQEKFNGIVERLKAEGWCDDPMYISVMVIVHYLDELQKLGLIESAQTLTESGKKIVRLVDEFEWKPSDNHLRQYVVEMIDEESQDGFFFMLKRYRDNKEELLEEVKKFRESGGE